MFRKIFVGKCSKTGIEMFGRFFFLSENGIGCQKRLVGVFLALLLFSTSAQAQSSSETDRTISIAFYNRSLGECITDLQAKTKLSFAFDPNIIPPQVRITKRFNNVKISDVLTDILTNGNLTYKLVANQIVIVKQRTGNYTIDGYITELKSGEPLIGASVYIPELNISTSSNQYGFYSLTVPAGMYDIFISHLEYSRGHRRVDLDENQTVSFALSFLQHELSEVVIGTAVKRDSFLLNQGVKNLTQSQVSQKAFYGGEADAIKALQMQTGVKAGTEGSSALFVRGGNLDQNLIQLDEAVVYNPSHLFGLISVFNPDAIKNVQLYKDFMPASFGGRLSSVLDVRMADGNNRQFHVKGGVSLLSARAAAEGPIVKGKGSFVLTYRRSLIDLLNKDYKLINPNSAFYDVNAKANYRLNRNNKIFYSFYGGQDKLFSLNSYGNQWGNLTSTVRLNHLFNSRLFLNLSGIYSDYKNSLDLNSDTVSAKNQWQTGIRDKTVKADFTWYKDPYNEIKFGGIFTKHYIEPGKVKNSVFQEPNIPKDNSTETAVYAAHKYNYKNVLFLNYGLRLTSFQNKEELFGVFDNKENLVQTSEKSSYWSWAPRANIIANLSRNETIQLSYNRSFQFLQLVQNSELAFSSLETWMPASRKTKPQSSNHYSLGYSYQQGQTAISINGFYKKASHQVDLLDHTQLIQNSEIREFLRYGIAESYGLEAEMNKQWDRLSTTSSYVFTRSLKRIADINNGEWFRANYDIPHEFKNSVSYAVSKQLKLSSFFILASGRPGTLPVGFYYHDGIQVPVYEKRNNSRFPVFNRLDLSARYNWKKTNNNISSYKHTLILGVYNVYDRKNPIYYRLSQATESSSLGIVNSSSRILPWFSYSFQL